MSQPKRTPKPKLSGLRSYKHPESPTKTPPDAGTQAQVQSRLKKKPETYRYDSSLAPELRWDGQNAAREEGEALIQRILQANTLEEAQAAAQKLKNMGRPFLNWTGKAERLSFDVPTLPLFVHERLSTEAIIAAVKRGFTLQQNLGLFGDEQRPIVDQILKPYNQGPWRNRMILGDSLVVMNSLIQYEKLGGQVQMIYIDPPYGVKFGSNFQPFVRRRDVGHNDDDDMTREPEMVQAYRDTWELGLHSYLTYLRDRLLLAREMLTPSGSVFVQISDDNLHHVREVMDEVFGAENFVNQITFTTTTSEKTNRIAGVCDFLLWYAKDSEQLKFNPIYTEKQLGGDGGSKYRLVEFPDGKITHLSTFEQDAQPVPANAKVFRLDTITSQRPGGRYSVEFEGKIYKPDPGFWKPSELGFQNLIAARRIRKEGNRLAYVRYFDDFSLYRITNVWDDLSGIQSRVDGKVYVVQTPTKILERCILMTTDPGDLVLDPTCGSGTTAYVAEQWGRRWVTIDTSRVPLALARQRLLTATFPCYELRDDARGPVGGFVYRRKQNRKGKEVGGIVPHITLKSIANNEPPAEEILVDRPEIVAGITRVAAPFRVEATIATPMDWDANGEDGASQPVSAGGFPERMLEVLRQSPVLHLGENKTVAFKGIRPPAKSLSLSAEAQVENGEVKPVAFVFGPENGAVSESLVYNAAKEANGKNFKHLYVIGFAVQPNARDLIAQSDETMGIPATYVQATPDLMMGDLLKNMRSSQIFSVAGLPDVMLKRVDGEAWQVELLGLDVFDPVTMAVDHRRGDDVPAWFLDSDYNGLCFRVSQAFFPRTAAWDNLKKALKGELNDSVWEHLSGTRSEPFVAGEQRRIAEVTLEPYRSRRRMQELVFDLAESLTRDFTAQRACEVPTHVLFPQLVDIINRYLVEKVEVRPPGDLKDLWLAPYYGFVIERLLQAIRPDTTQGEAPEVPRYERTRGPGSTADVDFFTKREVYPVVHSHLNYVVADTDRWEQSAAYFIDTHPAVAAFAKNAGLGFAIPYLHNGQMHDYIPDFLIRLKTEQPEYLILETKGYDLLKSVKRAAAERWVAAVNADGSYGHWQHALVTSMPDVRAAITDAMGRMIKIEQVNASMELQLQNI